MEDIILSIYIPTYNRVNEVVKQLQFFLEEMKEIDINRVEIIVNNNCSTDDTEEKVLKITEGTFVKYHKNTSNIGIVGNVYEAAKLVKGKYFWLVSDDDELRQGIVKRVLDIIDEYVGINAIFLNYSDYIIGSLCNGPNGLIENGVSEIIGKEYAVKVLELFGLAVSCVYLKSCFNQMISNISLEESESYGWGGVCFANCIEEREGLF